MISNVVTASTEAAGSAASASGESTDTGDTGAFDALLTLQSLAGEDTVTELTAQLAGALEGAELPGSADEAEDSDDTEAAPDDALAFLAALLPMPQKPLPATDSAVTTTSVPVQKDAVPASTASAAPKTGSADTTDLAKAFAASIIDAAGPDAKAAPAHAGVAAAATAVATPDATTWSYMAGPAEMFAHTARHSAERVESASLTTHVRDPRWADDLGNRIDSMIRTRQ